MTHPHQALGAALQSARLSKHSIPTALYRAPVGVWSAQDQKWGLLAPPAIPWEHSLYITWQGVPDAPHEFGPRSHVVCDS